MGSQGSYDRGSGGSGGTAPRRGALLPTLLVLGFVAVAVTSALAARALLLGGHEKQELARLAEGTSLFDAHVAETEKRIRAECWLMGEDTRLHSALGTLDRATIADLLEELRVPTKSDLLALVLPQGSVQVALGESALEGADLSTAQVIRAAREKKEPAVATWTLHEQLFSVAAYAIRKGDRIVAFIIHGYRIGEPTLTAVRSATGTSPALVIGGKISTRPTNDQIADEAFIRVAGSRSTGHVTLDQGGRTLIGQARAVEGSLPPAYVVWLRASGQLAPEYEVLQYLLWAPVLLAAALALLYAQKLISR